VPIFTPARLAQSNAANTTENTVYGPLDTGDNAIVQSVVFANVTAADATISLSLVPSGGTAGVANRLFEQVTIPARSTLAFEPRQVMGEGDFLSLKQSVASAVTTTISGVEF
jgi:hypothetical protein